jgi:hypothetical protein
MKKSVLILIGFVASCIFVATSWAQRMAPPSQPSRQSNAQSGEATLIQRPTATPAQAQAPEADVRVKYDAFMKQKKDGNYLLYTDNEGTRIYLPMKGGRPGSVYSEGKGGKAVAIRFSSEAGRCFACWGPIANPCKHKVQIKCASR